MTFALPKVGPHTLYNEGSQSSRFGRARPSKAGLARKLEWTAACTTTLGALQLRPEEQRVLRDDADFLAQAVQTDFRYVHAVDEGWPESTS